MSSPPRKNGKGRATDSEIPNEIISLAPPAEGEDPSLATHPGVACSGANCPRSNQWIHGIRYKCSVCKQQDFCRSCVGQPDNGHDTSHPLYECIGRSEFIEARRLATGELEFDETPSEGVQKLLALNNLCFNNEALAYVGSTQPEFPLRHMPKSCNGLALGDVEHHQDAGLLARVILGQVTKYDYTECQLRDLPGPRPAIARILELKPGDRGDKMSCEIKLTRLQDERPYKVVCCKWRDLTLKSSQDDIGNLLSNNRRHAVYTGRSHFFEASTPVFEALQAYRDPMEASLIWIDELCVDTAHEKRFQNRSRSMIMSQASQVIMWAGSAQHDLEVAYALIIQLAHHCNLEGGTFLSPETTLLDSHLPQIDSEEWQSLFRFFTPDVVESQWELEDISFALHPILQCGEYELDWWDIVGILKMLAQDCWKPYLVGRTVDQSSPLEGHSGGLL